MKVKTSVTLSVDTVRMIDRSLGRNDTRSGFVEAAVVYFLAEKARKEREARDREILDTLADELNAEAADVLRYQVRR